MQQPESCVHVLAFEKDFVSRDVSRNIAYSYEVATKIS